MEKGVIKTKLIEFISYAVEIIKLLLNFKWYIIFDFVFFLLLMYEYLNPPSVMSFVRVLSVFAVLPGILLSRGR